MIHTSHPASTLSQGTKPISPLPSAGKTFSFLVPTLARLVYPPDVFPEDLRGPQAIIVVPTMELGVQVWTRQLFPRISVSSNSFVITFESLITIRFAC